MRILHFNSFKERLNINKINIKDVDDSNIVKASHKNILPKPGMSLRDSLESGMTVLIDVGDYSPSGWKYRCYCYDEHSGELHCGDGLLLLVSYADDLTYEGGTGNGEWTIIKIYDKDPEINENMKSDYILEKLKTKKPIWVRAGYENVQI